MAASPAFMGQSLRSWSPVTRPLDGRNSGCSHHRTSRPDLHHSLVISVQTGTQIQSVEKINKNCNTAELQTNHRPDKMDQKQKRGDTESRMHMPSRHDSSVALSVIACEGNGCNTPFTKWRSPSSSSWCG